MVMKKSCIRFGKHCSLRRGLVGALDEAKALGCEAMQIFTRSPRMWRMKPPDMAEIVEFNRRRGQAGIFPLVVHTPYLPNLATSDKFLYERSVQAFTEDLLLSALLKADYLVIHPGAYSPGYVEKDGISAVSAGINRALSAAGGLTMVLLENMAGGGRRLGSSFRQLAAMIEGIKDKSRIGICLDTAHAIAAGYDLSQPRGIDKTLAEAEREMGLSFIKVVHCNDSRAPRGSARDRHENLGKGYIGVKGFSCLVRRLSPVAAAGIIETPAEPEGSDRRNLKLLFKWRLLIK